MSRRRTEGEGPKYMTTFMVAQALGVSPPTVVNWIDSGRLPAHRTPGKHRRIVREDVRAFALKFDYPLPVGFDDEDERAANAPLPPPRPLSDVTRVLVVDDQEDFANLVREYLVLRGGYEVAVALSGFAAGYAVAQLKPHVILMDILMPDMDGFQVLRRLKDDASTRSIPVIACTAYRDPHVEARVQQAGFVDYLEKPLRFELLADAVKRAVSARVAVLA